LNDLPLDPEPALGWRAWRLERRRNGLRLISLTRNDAWPARTAMRARCDLAAHDPAPSVGCSCGLYAAREPEDLPQAGVGAYNASVVGSVAMWGRVIEHEFGSRSQNAYPARFRLVCGPCLGEGRGAVEPILVFARSAALVSACATHAGGVADVLDARQVQSELLSTYAVDVLPIERVREALKTPPPTEPIRMRPVLEAAAAGVLLMFAPRLAS
jgi:hypothetical protein